MGFTPPNRFFKPPHTAPIDGEGDKRRRVVIAIQGGSALVAFAWGALDALLEQDHLHVLGATGTSAGAITAAYLVEGLIAGGHAHARHRLTTCWHGLSAFQKAQIPGWVSRLEMTHRLCRENPIFGAFYRAQSEVARRMGGKYETGAKQYFDYSLIMEFLRNTDAGRSLDFGTFARTGAPFIIGNSVHAPPGADLWHLPQHHERLHSSARFLAGAEPFTPDGMISGCAPDGMVPAHFHNGEWRRDGAYVANPHLGPELLNHCEQESATLVLIRSRPPGASGAAGSANDFNLVLDKQLAGLQEARPDLRLCTIAPSSTIADPGSFFTHLNLPELDFSLPVIEQRRAAGRMAAERKLASDPLLASPQRSPNASAHRLRREQLAVF